MSATAEEYIGINEAMRRYGMAVLTIRKRVARGDLTLYRDPLDDRRKLVKVSEMEALRTASPAPMHRPLPNSKAMA